VPGNANFGIDGNFGNTYTRGQAIISGAPSANFDFYFVEGVEGVATAPEPASAGMLAIGMLSVGIGGWARRLRSRPPL
jgi:hypothetical protein